MKRYRLEINADSSVEIGLDHSNGSVPELLRDKTSARYSHSVAKVLAKCQLGIAVIENVTKKLKMRPARQPAHRPSGGPPPRFNPSNPRSRKAGQQQQITVHQHYNKG